MPQNQVASVANYDFGAPITEDVVLSFRARENVGGKIDVLVENDSVTDLEVTVQVSTDGAAYTDVAGLANLAVQAKTHENGEFLLRAGVDLYFRVQAVGGTRGRIQFRGDALVNIIKI